MKQDSALQHPDEDSADATPVDAAVRSPEDTSWLLARRGLFTRAAVLTAVVLFLVAGLVLWLTGQFKVETVGYAGVWFFSLASAASILIPVPGIAAVCAAATPSLGLNPALIGVIAGSAEALGELTGYIAGVSGRSVLERNRLYPRLRELLLRFGGPALFFSSVIPNPLFDIMGIAAGSTGYPVRKFLLYVFLAKTIKSTGIAYGCFWGIGFVQGLFG